MNYCIYYTIYIKRSNFHYCKLRNLHAVELKISESKEGSSFSEPASKTHSNFSSGIPIELRFETAPVETGIPVNDPTTNGIDYRAPSTTGNSEYIISTTTQPPNLFERGLANTLELARVDTANDEQEDGIKLLIKLICLCYTIQNLQKLF